MRPIAVYLLFLLILFSFTSIFAQSDWRFVDETAERLPHIMSFALALDGGDVDGDGDLDLLVGRSQDPFGRPGTAQLFLNNEPGYFSLADSTSFPQINNWTTITLLFDCDGNAQIDAFMGNSNYQTDYLAINDGNGIFHIESGRLGIDSAVVLATDYGDIEGDGDIDICLLGNSAVRPAPRLWVNNGQGYFQNHVERLPSQLYPYYRFVGFADLNGDLAPDIVAVFYDSPQNESHPSIFINDGNGNFTDESNQRLPPTESFCWTVGLVDIDGDGDFDIILSYPDRLGFLINDGTGYFSDETLGRGPLFPSGNGLPYEIKSCDADNDGDEDLILGTGGIQNPDLIFINDGTGHYEDQTSLRWPSQANSTRKIFAGDLDGDGDCDIFRVGDGRSYNSIFINTLNAPDSIAPQIKNQTIYPSIDTSQGPYPVRLIAKDGIATPYQLTAYVLFSTDGRRFYALPMHYTGAYTYFGVLPEVDSGTTVYYSYQIMDRWQNTSCYPPSNTNSVLSFTYLPGYVGVTEDGNQLPERLSISAYPNPFNSATTLTISNADKANISIFDITGRLITTLHAENGRAIWDASLFPSGPYIARVEGRIAESIKLILLK